MLRLVAIPWNRGSREPVRTLVTMGIEVNKNKDTMGI